MKQRWIRFAIYGMAFGFGLSLTMLSPMMSRLVEAFSLSLTEGGLLTTAINLGGISGLVVLLVIADRVRKSKILWAAYAVFGLMLLGASFASDYVWLLLLLYGMGAGARVVDCVANAVMGDRFPESGAYLGLMHTFLGLGAFASPLLITQLAPLGWQFIFRAFGVLLTLLLIFSLTVEFTGRRIPLPTPAAQQPGDRKKLLRDGVFWLTVLMMFCYSGHQAVLASWGTMYEVGVTGLGDGAVNWILSCYWGGVVIGRASAAKWLPESASVPAVVIGSLASGLTLVGALLARDAALMAVCYLLTGVGSSFVVPVMVRYLYQRHPAQSGLISTICYFAMAASPLLFPLIAGAAADAGLFALGMQLSSAAILGIALLGIPILRAEHRR